MKRLIFLLLICQSCFSYGQTSAEIEVSNLPSSVKPGQYFSVFFSLTNASSLPIDVKSRLILPDKWKVLTEKKIGTDSLSIKYLFTISTPNQAASENYLIDFQIVTGDSMIGRKKVPMHVETVRHVEIIVLNQPQFVKEGDVLRVEYLIQNTGNTTERVNLETSRGVVENAKDFVEISPNSALKVVVKQDIPYADVGSWQTTSDLKISFPNQVVPIFQTVCIPVYFSKVKKNDPYWRLPVNVGGGYMQYTLGKKTTSAFQYFADGKGYLDASKKHFIDFILRSPNQFAFPTIGNYDQYSVAYSYLSTTNIAAGDYVLRFNNLMELGRFGRGLKIDQTVGNNNFIVFYQQARFFPNQKDAFGGSYKRKLNSASTIGVQFTSKNLIEKNTNFRSNLIGVSSFIKKEFLTNETEIALGNALNKFDFGGFNKLNFTYKRLIVNSEFVYAGKEFYGFYTNSLLFANGINYYLN